VEGTHRIQGPVLVLVLVGVPFNDPAPGTSTVSCAPTALYLVLVQVGVPFNEITTC